MRPLAPPRAWRQELSARRDHVTTSASTSFLGAGASAPRAIVVVVGMVVSIDRHDETVVT